MASSWYTKGLEIPFSSTKSFTGSTMKIMLLDTTYSFDADHDFVDDIVAHEYAGTGYTGGFSGSGRKTLASCTVTIDTANNRIKLDATDPLWTAISGSVGGAAIYFSDTNDASSPLLCFVDPADVNPSGGDYTIVFDSNGILRATVA